MDKAVQIFLTIPKKNYKKLQDRNNRLVQDVKPSVWINVDIIHIQSHTDDGENTKLLNYIIAQIFDI